MLPGGIGVSTLTKPGVTAGLSLSDGHAVVESRPKFRTFLRPPHLPPRDVAKTCRGVDQQELSRGQ